MALKILATCNGLLTTTRCNNDRTRLHPSQPTRPDRKIGAYPSRCRRHDRRQPQDPSPMACRRPGQPGTFRHAVAEVAGAYVGCAGKSVTLSRSVSSCPSTQGIPDTTNDTRTWQSGRRRIQGIPVHHRKTVRTASAQHRTTRHARKVPFPTCNPFVEMAVHLGGKIRRHRLVCPEINYILTDDVAVFVPDHR